MRYKSPREVEISFRVYGQANKATFDYVRFSEGAAGPADPQPVAMRLAVPLPAKRAYTASAAQDGKDVPVRLTTHGRWAQVEANLVGRTIIRLTPR